MKKASKLLRWQDLRNHSIQLEAILNKTI